MSTEKLFKKAPLHKYASTSDLPSDHPPTAMPELVEFQQQTKEDTGSYIVRARRHVQDVKMLYWQAAAQAREKGRKLPDLFECVAITLLERGLAPFNTQQYRLSNVLRFNLEEMRTVTRCSTAWRALPRCASRTSAALRRC
ncbi:hypothetical protein JKP88DRAFT_253798 [Tribonema minus]|uniref:Uncharacterized protein n=1 Tax=Tribonema minus TaxID=303371 RepID=A0A835Z8X0_9STRA|nr:hypothetical protein JKP88DRAFT_253798 [Tribonema minus]